MKYLYAYECAHCANIPLSYSQSLQPENSIVFVFESGDRTQQTMGALQATEESLIQEFHVFSGRGMNMLPR